MLIFVVVGVFVFFGGLFLLFMFVVVVMVLFSVFVVINVLWLCLLCFVMFVKGVLLWILDKLWSFWGFWWRLFVIMKKLVLFVWIVMLMVIGILMIEIYISWFLLVVCGVWGLLLRNVVCYWCFMRINFGLVLMWNVLLWIILGILMLRLLCWNLCGICCLILWCFVLVMSVLIVWFWMIL